MPSMTLTCRVCNLPMQKVKTSKPQGEAAHNACRRGLDTKRNYMLRWHAEYRAKHGTHYSTMWRRRFRDEIGHWPTHGSSDWISFSRRHGLYERDKWTCYLCGDVLSVDAPANSPKQLTLDHVRPRSKGGSHDSDNLKTCCRECNVRKSDHFTEGSV